MSKIVKKGNSGKIEKKKKTKFRTDASGALIDYENATSLGRPRIWTIVLIHFFEIVYSLFILFWYYLAYFIPNLLIINILNIPEQLLSGDAQLVFFILATAGLYAIPALALFKIFGIFLKVRFPSISDTSKLFSHGVNVILSMLPIIYLTLYISVNAKGLSFFAGLSVYTYAVCGASLLYNFFFIILFIRNINKKNETYHEYLTFRKKMKDHDKNFLKVVVRMGIQKKLVLSFIAIVLILISALSYILLSEYRRSILSTIIYNGTVLAERSASVIRTNLGDEIAIEEYFIIESRKNLESSFPFRSISFYQKGFKDGIFQVMNSTDAELVGKNLKDGYVDIIETSSFYNKEDGIYDFISPISLAGKLIGYLLVTYDEAVIYSSYFNTQVRIIIFCIFFLYTAVIIIYIFGSQIVFPILFLRMSVNKLSSNLAQMIRGELKVSANLLSYNDIVHTKDEIKTLSSEIKNMAGVIQGVVPYISTSTFKNVDKGGATSVKKNMTFLFTDIRGFTTLCEGMSPKDIVGILNRFLDIQSSIILANNGDVDKFVGDEMMASFDGPRKEINACRAAMEIRKAMAEENETRTAGSQSAVHIGIGINTGEVVFGSVGAKERMDFTSIGDAVNLAARLEGANKAYGTKTLISQAVFSRVKDYFLCRQIDLMTVKGKTQPVRIYEMLQIKSRASKKLEMIKKTFENGLARYRRQEWDAAEKFFKQAVKEYDDAAADVFLERIKMFRKNPPPANWDGVFNLLVK